MRMQSILSPLAFSALLAGAMPAMESVPIADPWGNLPETADSCTLPHPLDLQPGPDANRVPRGNQDFFDVLDYELGFANLGTVGSTGVVTNDVEGSNTITLRSGVDGLTTVTLDFSRVLSIREIRDPDTSVPLAYARDTTNQLLEVGLDGPLAAGEVRRLRIDYHGTPGASNIFGYPSLTIEPGGLYVSSFSEPYGSRDWWPCKDRPDDRATVTMRITTPADREGVSNGSLSGVTDNPDGTRTWTWRESHPIPTYLVALNAGDLLPARASYPLRDGSREMPVTIWTRPDVNQTTATLVAGQQVPRLAYFADTFGEYPFADEKYDVVEFRVFSGGMEHATATSASRSAILSGFIAPGTSILTHELAHQWFGDSVTVDSWEHVWLNEGFASYCEALFAESQWAPALYTVMSSFSSTAGTPLLNPSPMFSATVYHKGAWVLHQLRWILGEEAFFAVLREYLALHRDGTATSADFQSVCEAHYGGSLDWYFQPWLTLVGMPTISLGAGSYRSDDGHLHLAGIATITAGYRMPVQLRAMYGVSASSPDVTIMIDSASTDQNQFAVDLGPALQNPAISSVVIDPNGWIRHRNGSSLPVPFMGAPEDHPTAHVGETYFTNFHAIGGSSPGGEYLWTLESGAIPPGVRLVANSLFGVPQCPPGDYAFVLRVTDHASPPHTALLPVTITVTHPGNAFILK